MKKRTCMTILSLLTTGTLLMTACNSSGTESGTELKDGQTLSYAQIVSINGNEVTLAWATATSSEDVTFSENETRGEFGGTADTSNENETGSQSSDGSDTSQEQDDSSDNQMPGGNMDGGQMPGNSGSDSGQMPDGSDMGGGQMPQGNNMSGENSTASSDDSSDNRKDKSEMQEQETEETIIYTLTGEEDTMYIPVGTTVTTELGATTTFSRLASGDMVELVLEQDTEGNNVIVSVSIVQ